MEWKDKTRTFKQIDVRGIQGNFFQGLKKQAMQLPAGSGLEIVQSFDPIPLYGVMEGLGFEHFTEQKDEAEFHAYFYRKEVKQEEKDIPMRPAALTNMPLIDEKLGNIAVNFWDLTWNDAHRHLPYEIRLLLSLTNAVGAGRMRQATRELVKAADKLSAYLKCVEEVKAGNNEFKKAKEQTYAALCQNQIPALRYFMDRFLDGFELTLDELSEE